MRLKREAKIATQSPHSVVIGADPFTAKFTDEFGRLAETVRKNSPACSLQGLKNCDIPAAQF